MGLQIFSYGEMPNSANFPTLTHIMQKSDLRHDF
jgi:hypothetical protein